ncbi:MAG: tRNA (mnm(5)s(2)U34)-methyltransferase [Erysipelotrichaceae bacterium]
MNVLNKTTQLVHYILQQYLTGQSIAIDCTVGNGHDTLFLAQRCKFVYGFDIQKQAIDNTDELLRSNELDNYRLILDSHSEMAKYICEPADAIVFNLGYLPCSDKTVTTTSLSTVAAVKQALQLLSLHGVIAITIYYGHPGGKQERKDLLSYLSSIDSNQFAVRWLSSLNSDNCPPEIVFITHRGK